MCHARILMKKEYVTKSEENDFKKQVKVKVNNVFHEFAGFIPNFVEKN